MGDQADPETTAIVSALDDVLGNIDVDLGTLDLTGDEINFDEGHIEENLQDEVVREALAQGLDLRVYSKQIEAQLGAAEQASVNEYLAEATNMALLHVQLQGCDDILCTMERLLGAFQDDLGNISGQIEALQGMSQEMSVKVANRKEVLVALGSLVDNITMSAEMVETILATAPIGDDFDEAVSALDNRFECLEAQGDDMACGPEATAALQRLAQKAVVKLRDYFMQKIMAIRKPGSNPQLQQNAMAKHRVGFRFLSKYDRAVASEVRDAYVDTMSKVHFTYFKTYLARLLKLQYEEVGEKDDLLGSDDGQKRGGLFAFNAIRGAAKPKSTTFTLGARASLLQEFEAPIMVPLTAKEGSTKETKVPYERLFRSLQYALTDSSAREFMFCVELFGSKGSHALDFFKAVMGKTMLLLLKQEEERIGACFDAISLLLCARIVTFYETSLNEKHIPCLDHYFLQLHDLIWPRFSFILNMHIDSVLNTDPQKMSNLDTRPHYIVRRYAEFSGALLQITEGYEYGPVSSGLADMKQQVENLILRVAAEFSGRKEQLIFLINNYDMMLSVYGERQSHERDDFLRLLEARSKEFAEEALAPPFGAIITFVKDIEGQIARGERDKSGLQSVTVDPRRVQNLIRGFAKDWKKNIDELEKEIMSSFANFKNGTNVLQQVLTQLILYYERFLNILKNPPFKRPGGYDELVDRHVVMNAVKKMHKAMVF